MASARRGLPDEFRSGLRGGRARRGDVDGEAGDRVGGLRGDDVDTTRFAQTSTIASSSRLHIVSRTGSCATPTTTTETEVTRVLSHAIEARRRPTVYLYASSTILSDAATSVASLGFLSRG